MQLDELQLELVIGLNPHPNSVAHHPGRQEVAYCAGSVVVLYDANSNVQRAFLRASSAPSKPFISVSYSPDGAFLAAGESGSHPSLVIWDTETCACLVELKGHKHGVCSVAFSPSGEEAILSLKSLRASTIP
jgi:WD40 repeat protein